MTPIEVAASLWGMCIHDGGEWALTHIDDRSLFYVKTRAHHAYRSAVKIQKIVEPPVVSEDIGVRGLVMGSAHEYIPGGTRYTFAWQDFIAGATWTGWWLAPACWHKADICVPMTAIELVRALGAPSVCGKHNGRLVLAWGDEAIYVGPAGFHPRKIDLDLDAFHEDATVADDMRGHLFPEDVEQYGLMHGKNVAIHHGGAVVCKE